MLSFKTLLIGSLLLSVAAGQQEKPKTYPQRVANGLRATVTAPTMCWHWAATGAGVLLALPFDNRLKQQAVDQGLMPKLLARFGDEWGGKWAAISILPGIFVIETIRGTPQDQTFQRLDFAFTSLAMVGITTQVLKNVVRRERPNRQSRTAFPSGHTSAAFGVAEGIRTLYGNGIGAVCYGMAIITGLSRIHDNKHYLSDVVAGAGLGMGLVRGFAIAQTPNDQKAQIQVSFSARQIRVGLAF